MEGGLIETTSAARMRRHRERRRAGLHHVSLNLNDSEIGVLISHGLLEPVARHDRGAIGKAVRSFFLDAVDWARRPKKPGSFTVEIGDPEIDVLVRRNFLTPSARRNPDLVMWAFGDFLQDAFHRR